MGLQIPESMDECLYFSNRSMGDGKAKAWVRRIKCDKCKEGLMGKPINEKTGKVDKKAENYQCHSCGHTEEKGEHEAKLSMEIIYTCPECKHEGEASTEYKLKTWKGVKAYVFVCEGCNEKLGVTKKMKDPKPSKKKK